MAGARGQSCGYQLRRESTGVRAVPASDVPDRQDSPRGLEEAILSFQASPGEWTAVSAHTRPCLPGFTCRARPCLPGFTCRANGCVSARPALLLGALWLCGPTLMTSAVLLPPLPPFGCSSQVESSAPEATLLKVPCTLALDGDCRGTVVARQGKAWGPR